MQLATLLVALLALAPLKAASASESRIGLKRSDGTPLSKVVELLGDMRTKGIKEMEAEQVEFSKFTEWCSSTQASTSKSIKKSKAEIVQLTADAQKASADAEELAAQISDTEAAVAKTEEEAKKAKEVREKENADYKATHADLSESLVAIERAIQVLKKQAPDVKQGSLAQVQSSLDLPHNVKEAIESFVAMQQAPEANAYEFQSTGVVEMLDKLLSKFQAERESLEKEELAAKHSFALLSEQFSNELEKSKASIEDKQASRAKCLEDEAEAKGSIQTTSASLKEDSEYLAKTAADCKLKTAEITKNQEVRKEEIEAIDKALEILKSEAVSGAAEEHLPAMLVQKDARHIRTALVQLHAQDEGDADFARRRRVTELLRERAQQTGSQYLALIAARAEADPFGKVKKMIKELIYKLKEEANAEADQQAYCQTELATNKATREAKASEVDELSAQLDAEKAKIAQLTTALKDLSEEIAAVKADQLEASKQRAEEKAANAKTIKEAQAAQVAVQKAHQVLQEYYAKASNSGETFLQEGLADEMQSAGKAPYKGMQAEGGGILGFLEVIASDFARLEADTTSEEDAAETEFKNFMTESEKTVAVKQTEVDHKTAAKQKSELKAKSLGKELKLTQEELAAANEYYEKLKPECIDTGMSYKERVAMREAEITSLKEALEVLS